jgi:hypothetical protein
MCVFTLQLVQPQHTSRQYTRIKGWIHPCIEPNNTPGMRAVCPEVNAPSTWLVSMPHCRVTSIVLLSRALRGTAAVGPGAAWLTNYCVELRCCVGMSCLLQVCSCVLQGSWLYCFLFVHGPASVDIPTLPGVFDVRVLHTALHPCSGSRTHPQSVVSHCLYRQ